MLSSATNTLSCLLGASSNAYSNTPIQDITNKFHEQTDSFVSKEFFNSYIKPCLELIQKTEATAAAVATGNTAYVASYVNAEIVPIVDKIQTAVDYSTGLLNNPAGFIASKVQSGYSEIAQKYDLPSIKVQIPTSVTGALSLISGVSFTIPTTNALTLPEGFDNFDDPQTKDSITQAAEDMRDRLSKFFSAHTSGMFEPVTKVVDEITKIVPADIISDIKNLGLNVFNNAVSILTNIASIINNPTTIATVYVKKGLNEGLKVLYENDIASANSTIASVGNSTKQIMDKVESCNVTNIVSVFI